MAHLCRIFLVLVLPSIFAFPTLCSCTILLLCYCNDIDLILNQWRNYWCYWSSFDSKHIHVVNMRLYIASGILNLVLTSVIRSPSRSRMRIEKS